MNELGKNETSLHVPEIRIDPGFREKISHNLREFEVREQLFAKTYEEVENMKQIVLFH